jgi:hypothetical protein
MEHALNRTTVTLVLFAFVAAGCGTARLVEKTQTGGIIALEGDKDKAWEDANSQIKDHCGDDGHHIVREGEHVIGETTEYDERTEEDKRGTSTGGDVTTSDLTEWRVEYMCGEPTPEPASEPASKADDKSPSAKFADEEKAAAPAEEAASAPADESPSAKRAREEREAIEKKKKEAAGDQ